MSPHPHPCRARGIKGERPVSGSKRPYGVFCQTRNTLGFSAVAQESEIAARDWSGGIADERDDSGAQGRCLPGFGADAFCAVDRDTDLAEARAIGAPVGRPHHQAKALSLIRGHPGIARHGARLEPVPEPLDSLDPARQVVIERQDDGERSA